MKLPPIDVGGAWDGMGWEGMVDTNIMLMKVM